MKQFLYTLLIFCLIGQAYAQGPRRPQFNASYPSVHDPVMAVGDDGRYYIFATGAGIQVLSSADLKTWKPEKPVFGNDEIPQWAKDSVRGYWGHTWAPDIQFHDGLWYLYYSCSTFGKNGSAIGLATNKTLNPNSADFKWVDRGPVIVSHRHKDNFNAIDPNLIFSVKGKGKRQKADKPYLTFGSFWDGIQLLPLADDLQTPLSAPVTIARRIGRYRALAEIDNLEHYTFEGNDTIQAGDNAVEAPFIIYREGYYYLFVSQDYCCRGKNSTYRTVYGRSKKVEGPYLDRKGLDMAFGGGTLLVGPSERYYGIGHNSAYQLPDGRWMFVCHAYDAEQRAMAKLFMREMQFTKDGWIELKEK